MAEAALAVIILVPVALTFLLKSNAALAFLTLCVGFVLSTSVIGDLKNLLSQINLSTTSSTLGLVLLAAPPLITLILTRHANTKGLMRWLQLAASLCVGGLLALSIGPILNISSQLDVTKATYWEELTKIQSGIIGIGSLLSLFLVWTGNLKPHGKKHK
jgi:hypothetical protein